MSIEDIKNIHLKYIVEIRLKLVLNTNQSIIHLKNEK